jgi:hypothetical protein
LVEAKITRIGAHRAQDIDRAFNVRQKNAFGVIRRFVELGGEMNDDIVIFDNGRVLQIQQIEIRAARKIIGAEILADVSSQKTAAAGNENFHKLDYTERKGEEEKGRMGERKNR